MKNEISQAAYHLFIAYGPHRITLEEISHTLGISKKTIYKYFESKEQLIENGISFGIQTSEKKLEEIFQENTNPVRKILMIYCFVFQRLQELNPAFLYELKRYYPHAFSLVENFRMKMIDQPTISLLEKAKQQGMIRPEVNTGLFVKLHLTKIENVISEVGCYQQLKDDNTLAALFKHLIFYNMQGILEDNYTELLCQNHSA